MLLIRRWEYKDTRQVADIEADSFKDVWTYQMLADTFLSKNFYGFVAEFNGGVIGYGGFINVSGDADITKIAVKKEFRRQGIGVAILAEMLKECKRQGVSRLTLEVRTDNKAAIALYKNSGFEFIAERKDYYAPGEDAHVMQRVF